MCRAGTCYTCRSCCCCFCCLDLECFEEEESKSLFDKKTPEEKADEDSEETPEPTPISDAFCGSYGQPLFLFSTIPCIAMPLAVVFYTMFLYYVSNQEVICELAHEQDFLRNLIISCSYYAVMLFVFGLLFCCDRNYWVFFYAIFVTTVFGFCIAVYILIRIYDGNINMFLMTPEESTSLLHCSVDYWYGINGYMISLLPNNESDYWISPITNLSCRLVFNDFGYCPEMRSLLNVSAFRWDGDVAFYESCEVPYDQAYPICSRRPLHALMGELIGHGCSLIAIVSYFVYLWWISCRQYYKYCCECFKCCKSCDPFCRAWRCCPRDGAYKPGNSAPPSNIVVPLGRKNPIRPWKFDWTSS
jgi:hypothetical protein